MQPDNVMAYDNAVSALGKICQYHRESIDSAQVVCVCVRAFFLPPLFWWEEYC